MADLSSVEKFNRVSTLSSDYDCSFRLARSFLEQCDFDLEVAREKLGDAIEQAKSDARNRNF